MLNGLLTLRGAWDKLRTDPVIKFFVVAVTFYGMSTFEGPLLSIKSVSALGHYTDWIIGHVHGGALGWNGFMAVGMLYWLVPRLWGTKLCSVRARRRPLLDRDVRHPALRGRDVDQRREPGAVLARARRRRLPQVPRLHRGPRRLADALRRCAWSAASPSSPASCSWSGNLWLTIRGGTRDRRAASRWRCRDAAPDRRRLGAGQAARRSCCRWRRGRSRSCSARADPVISRGHPRRRRRSSSSPRS